tara:strand:- start:2517 stop:3773 length:1257 start_codon:yes stop_codon:yes gene_type:complete
MPVMAYTSSNFLISQLAYKNHDYETSLFDFNIDTAKYPNNDLLDKLIASVILENLEFANNISDNILKFEKDNQEAYLVKLVNLLLDNKSNEIKKLYSDTKTKNDLIDFIFFNDDLLKDNQTISKSIIDIVTSSFSNSDGYSLNYSFLLFYTSLARMIDTSNDRATLIKGELFQKIGNDRDARLMFKEINQDSDFYLDAQINLALNYSFYLSYDEAIKNINKLLEKNNNLYPIKKILADTHRIEKNYKFAIQLYNEMIERNENDLWSIYYLRGICFERLGQWDKAEKNFLKSLDLKPDSPNVLNYLAYGWVERNIRLDQSLEMLKAAYAANPESSYIIDSLAWAYFKKNNYTEAAKLMEKVIDIAPGEAISLDHLGDIYYAMNRKREAIHFWQQALELAEPEDEITEDVQSKLDKINAG